MKRDDMKRTDSGFIIFGQIQSDDREQSINIVESSEVGPLRCWIKTFGGPWDPPHIHMGRWLWPAPYLNLEQAKALHEALGKFIAVAEDPNDWRNDPRYKAQFWD